MSLRDRLPFVRGSDGLTSRQRRALAELCEHRALVRPTPGEIESLLERAAEAVHLDRELVLQDQQCGSERARLDRVWSGHLFTPPCPSLSPESKSSCHLPDSLDAHRAGHESDLDSETRSRVSWPAVAVDHQRWGSA